MVQKASSPDQVNLGDPKFIQQMLDHVPGMVAVYHVKTGKYIYVNKSVKQVLGYTPEDFINGGMEFSISLMHPDDLKPIMEQNKQAVDAANKLKTSDDTPIATFEYRFRHKNGTYRWLHTDGSVLSRDKNGKIEHVMNISIDITQRRERELKEANIRKQFEQKILQSEKRFRSLIENSYEAVIIADKNGNFTYASPSIKKVLGFTPNEIIGRSTLELFPEKYREEEIKKFGDVAQIPGKTVKVISRYMHKNGKILFVESTVSNRLSDPFVQGFVSNFRDITTELEAFEKQRYLAAIVSSSDDAIISKTLDGIITSWNKSAQSIFGYTAKEAVGKHIFLIIPPEHQNEEERIISTLKSGRHIDHFETIRQTKSGKRINVSLTISPIRDDNGTIIGASKIARDITQKKKYEQEIKQSQERLKLAVDAGKIGIWDWDIINNKIVWSDRVYDIHGVKKGTNIGELEKYRRSHHPEDAARVNEAIKKALVDGEKQYQEEFRILTPTGQTRWVETKAIVIRDEDNKPIRMLGATTDVTRRKNLEQQKDEFIGIASHELKTPVTSLKAYAQLLETKFRREGNEKSAQLLGRMNGQLDKLTGLISDLLDVTKIETGKLQFHEEHFDFNELVTEIVQEIRPTTQKHELITALDKTKTIYGDRDRIGQVLTNFLTNAVKYSPHGKEIIIKTVLNSDMITVSVTDSGIGIPKNLQAHVFERFFRATDPNGQTFPGMGLGLYISSQIIQRQQGKIWLESKKGKGSTFSFSLPLQRKGVKRAK